MSLSLGGVTIPNDGYVLASGIGEGGASLHCKPRNFFYRNRYPGVVRLNRIGNPPERGRFHCEIANAASDMVTMYVNIGEWFDHRR